MGSVSRVLTVGTESIQYISRVNKRARHIRISLYPNGRIAVTRPVGVSLARAENFLIEKYDWVRGKIKKRSQAAHVTIPYVSSIMYPHVKEEVYTFVVARLNYFNHFYGFKYNHVAIKRHKTLWGSCSAKSNVNFNYKILFLPQEIADYIVVHELCHVKEHNHSLRFWALVARTIPDWKERKKQLRLYRL